MTQHPAHANNKKALRAKAPRTGTGTLTGTGNSAPKPKPTDTIGNSGMTWAHFNRLASAEKGLALLKAVQARDTQAVLRHIQDGGNVDYHMGSPLQRAVENSDAVIVGILLKHGAKISTSGPENLMKTAIRKHNSEEVIRLLYRHHRYTRKTVQNFLYEAAAQKNQAAFDFFRQKGARPDLLLPWQQQILSDFLAGQNDNSAQTKYQLPAPPGPKKKEGGNKNKKKKPAALENGNASLFTAEFLAHSARMAEKFRRKSVPKHTP